MNEGSNERPGRSWEEYGAILVRRRWWILVPLFFCWVAVWAISWLLPVEYQSESVLGVDRQKVPEQYVTPDATFNLPDWLQDTEQLVLTRPRLQELIEQIHLSPGSGAWAALFGSQDPVDRMRQDIRIEPIEFPGHPGNYTSFRILCTAQSSEAARQVNEQVTSLFLAENAIGARQRSQDTFAFLDDELAHAREDINAQQATIAAFEEQHLGQLPSQLEANVQILGGLQTQLQSVQRSLDAARQQKLYLDSLLQEYRSAQLKVDAASQNATASQALDKELMELQLKLESLRSRYTEDYPDISVVKQAIAKTEELKERLISQAGSAEAGEQSSGSDAASPAAIVGQILPSPIVQVQSQQKANALEIQNDQQRERDLESQIATYQSRLNLAPETERALNQLSAGYEESKRNYDSLLQKQMQSQLVARLEERQGAEQLQVLDPPSVPEQPSSPDRLRISLAGLLTGLAIGLGLTIFRELTDSRIHNYEQLHETIPVSVLVAIPRLSTPRENASLQARKLFEVVAAAAIVVIVVAGNLLSLYKS